MAAQNGAAHGAIAQRVANAYIGTASGPSGSEPDWIDLLARDRGTARQAGESTELLRARLRTIPSGIIGSELLAAANALLVASGLPASAAMLEFAHDAAYLGTWTATLGTAGMFTKTGSLMAFRPAETLTWPPYSASRRGFVASNQLKLASCTDAGNNGSFTITGLSAVNDGAGHPTLTAIHYTNASGSAGYDAAAAWTLERLNHAGKPMNGHGRAFVNRGCRIWRGQRAGVRKAMGGFLIILPHGTSEPLRLSVLEMLRSKKAAGVRCIVERRIGVVP